MIMDTLLPDRVVGPFELWRDTTTLSYVGVIGESVNFNIVLGYAFITKDANAVNWLKGIPVILTRSLFKSPQYSFICTADNIAATNSLLTQRMEPRNIHGTSHI